MKSNYIICILVLFSLGNINAGDMVIKGVIKDSTNQQPLSYVNIGVVNTPIGTVTAPDGSFELFLEDIDTLQKIRVSHIGYEQQFLSLNGIKHGEFVEILLQPYAFPLESIQIKATKLFPKMIGCKKTKTKMNVFFAISKQPHQNLGAAIGKKIKIKKKFYLDTIGFYIQRNNFDTVRFRINIHKLKESKPVDLLNQKPIIVELVNQRKGWIEVDLKPYAIKHNQSFIPSIEWIYHSKKGNQLQMPIAIPRLASTHYYRYGSQNKWKRFRAMSSAIYVKVRTE